LQALVLRSARRNHGTIQCQGCCLA
jgi:hypothetical protein